MQNIEQLQHIITELIQKTTDAELLLLIYHLIENK